MHAGQYCCRISYARARLSPHVFSGWSKSRQDARDQARRGKPKSVGREWYSLAIRRKNVAPRACPGRRSREGPAQTSPECGELSVQLSFVRLVKTLLKVFGKVFTSNPRLLFGTGERRPTLASPLTTTVQFVQHPEATALPSAKRCKPIVPCRKVSSKVLSRLYSFIWLTITPQLTWRAEREWFWNTSYRDHS